MSAVYELTPTISQVVTTFQRWLYMPDDHALLATLGAYAANRLEGDPVWLLLVGPPGGGKSELLQALGQLEGVHPAATLTEPALLSGTPKRDKDSDAKGGLLRSIGEFGVIVCKDFGSILNMHRDARSAVLAALREVYDGDWTRHVGTDGGRTLHWAGKVGLLAGCTPTIDRHHAVMGSMGERFVLLRLPCTDGDEQARRALAHAGHEMTMRAELSEAVARLFADGLPASPRELDSDEQDRLVSLVTLIVRCRSAVERDSYTREVELIPDAEAPTRLIVVLQRLLAGLSAIGVGRAKAWDVACQVALDSIPAIRRAVLHELHAAEAELTTADVATAIGYPTQTTRRALEDLAAHRIVNRAPGGQGKADQWTLTSWARERYARTVPETSDAHISPLRTEEDISGTVASP